MPFLINCVCVCVCVCARVCVRVHRQLYVHKFVIHIKGVRVSVL
jgi:hypothetical protein